MRYPQLSLVLIFLFACNDKSKSIDDTGGTNFDSEHCTSLVLYAANANDDEPNEKTPSLILHDYDSERNFFGVDNTPILSVLDKKQIIEKLSQTSLRIEEADDLAIAGEILDWVEQKHSEGYSWFLYELEPVDLAGIAYPIAAVAQKE